MHSEQYIRVDYTRAEIMTDAAVHAVGFAAAVIAVPTLVILSAFWFRDMTVVAASAIYGLSVLAMFVCSAIYNIFSPPEWKDTFRRLDQSAIYLKIAGSYTPFAVLAGSGSVLLLTFVWLTAALGAGLIVFSPRRMRRLSWPFISSSDGPAHSSAARCSRPCPRPVSISSCSRASSTPPGSASSSGTGCPFTTRSGTFSSSQAHASFIPLFSLRFPATRQSSDIALRLGRAPYATAARTCTPITPPVLHMQRSGGCTNENYRAREAGDRL